MKEPLEVTEDDELICTKCGGDIEVDGEELADFQAARTEHLQTCPGPEYRGKLTPCPFCGSKDIDPKGGLQGRCQCPDAAAHAIMQCEQRHFPVCDDCGATAETVELWNTRARHVWFGDGDQDRPDHYLSVYEDVWKSIVENEDGTLNVDQVKRELSDYAGLLDEVPKVYMEISGGRISYPNTYASSVLGEAQAVRDEEISTAYHEAFGDIIKAMSEAADVSVAAILGAAKDVMKQYAPEMFEKDEDR